MQLQSKLKILQFLQFFIWGSWLITAGSYMWSVLHFTGVEIGSVYAAMGLASIFSPSIMGIISDKWIPAKYLYILCHAVGAICLFLATQTTDYGLFYLIMLINLFAYMPTIALSYSICYACFDEEKIEAVSAFPPVRIWGTIGFIIAMWSISLLKISDSASQFYLASVTSVVLCLFVLIVIPKFELIRSSSNNVTLTERLGLNAFVLFKENRMAVFLIFSVLLGVVLQISNTWADPFIKSFGENPKYAESFFIQYSTIIVSLSQISEVVFILLVPFFLKRFGIKYVMMISMFAWFFRFGFFGIGGAEGMGMGFIILSMIVYGCAFDFFNISGSLYVEKRSAANIRNSAQGLFMTLTNGVGGFVGSYAAGMVVDKYSVYEAGNFISRDWSSIWICFAGYALILAIVFFFVFKNKKDELGLMAS